MTLDIVRTKDFDMLHALEEISLNYNKRVAYKLKSLRKFGRNDTVGTTAETVWETGGNEVMLTDDLITTVSSSDASDTGEVYIEGHTIDESGNLTFVTQTITLTGQTQATLTTPLARATRLRNNSATDFVGTVYVYEDDTSTAGVPDTAAKVHLTAKPGDNRSLKCATSISQNDFWVLTGMSVSVNEKQTASVDFTLQIREQGKVFETVYQIGATNAGSPPTEFPSPIIVPSNSDVRVIAKSSTAGTSVNATLYGYLAS